MSSRVHRGPSIKPPDNEHTVRRTVNFERNYSSILSVKPPLSQLHPALNLVRFPPSSPPLSPIPLSPLDPSEEALMQGCTLRLHRSTCHFLPLPLLLLPPLTTTTAWRRRARVVRLGSRRVLVFQSRPRRQTSTSTELPSIICECCSAARRRALHPPPPSFLFSRCLGKQ